MSKEDLEKQLAKAKETIRILQEEFAETNRGLNALNLELEQQIEERKRVEEKLAQQSEEFARINNELSLLNKELASFSYSVSHDLRAPLTGIYGFSQALLEDYSDKIDEQGKDNLKRVCAAAQRMSELIDALLILSQVTRAEINRQNVDLSVIAHTIAGELKKTQPEREMEFIIQEGLIASCDVRLFRLVLQNLLGNAWKFTSKCPSSQIEFGMTEVDGKSAYFVRDNGAGFDMTYASNLFGAFQRLHSTKEFPGTGIGLATVQRIILRHGGNVWAEGLVDKGATFYFTL